MKNDIKNAFNVAASYFGIIVGPAMVSGTFAVSYYSKYGINAFWLPILTVLLAGLLIYKGIEFARINQCYDYDSFSQKLFGKFYRYMKIPFNILMIIIGIVSVSIHFAFGASLIQTVTGLNFFLSCIVITFLILLITVFGEKITRKVNKVMFLFLLGITVTFTCFVLVNKGISVYPEWILHTSLTSGILMSIMYGFAGSIGVIMPVIAISEEISSKRQSALTAIISMILNYVIILLTVLITLSYCPDVLESDAPVLTILLSFKTQWLGTLYSIILFLAIMSSAPCLLLGQTRRWTKLITSETISVEIKRLLVAIIFSIGACFIAGYGVKSIVTTMFTILSIIAIPVLYVPIVVRKND